MPNSHQLCIYCYVSGKVQGVFFRAFTCDEAQRLNVTGFVRNLPDGRVEVVACGDQDKVNELYQSIQKGPTRAEVDHVSYEEIPLSDYHSFEVT